MKNKKAGERKRTVTVTLNKPVEDVLMQMQKHLAERPNGWVVEMTRLATICLEVGLTKWAREEEILKAGESYNAFS
jgi:hypothetical protein